MVFLWNRRGDQGSKEPPLPRAQGRLSLDSGVAPTLSTNGAQFLHNFRMSIGNAGGGVAAGGAGGVALPELGKLHLPNVTDKSDMVSKTTSVPSTAATERMETPLLHLRKQFAQPISFKQRDRAFQVPFRSEAVQVDRNFLSTQREFGFQNKATGIGGVHPLAPNGKRQSVHTLYEGSVIAEIQQSVKKPDGVSSNLWLANNFVKIFKEISMVSSFMMNGLCTEKSCPVMRAGTHNYLWQDNHADGTVSSGIQLSAPKYIKGVLDTAQRFLNDPRVFPGQSGKDFPACFQELVGPVLRRFFRCYCHFYRHHLQQMEDLGIEKRVRFCAAFCSLFCLEHDICSNVEYETIQPLIDAWVKEAAPQQPATTSQASDESK
ncbi:unnamed protein product [Amoebophrya sp. A25]|nr:unnamed protein product [Amoebophrya sp. A25]|eukprot:GSA25T00020223001.1